MFYIYVYISGFLTVLTYVFFLFSFFAVALVCFCFLSHVSYCFLEMSSVLRIILIFCTLFCFFRDKDFLKCLR